jgi:hypothetical protein
MIQRAYLSINFCNIDANKKTYNLRINFYYRVQMDFLICTILQPSTGVFVMVVMCCYGR